MMSLYAVRIAASITPPVLPKMIDAPVSIPIKSSNLESSKLPKSTPSSLSQRMNSRVVMEISVSMPRLSSS